MARIADEFDLSELLAQLARSGMEACCTKGIVFLYDHEGLHANVRGAQERLSALVFAIMARAIHLARGGHVFFGAEVLAGRVGECHLVLQWALSTPRSEFPREWAVLGDTEGAPWNQPVTIGAGGAQLMTSKCPHTAAQLTVLSFAESGAVVRLEVDLPWLGPAGAWADARGARAWLLASAAGAAQSEVLTRRLQRLGWHTVGFEGPAQALAHLHERPREFAPPSLIVRIADDDVSLRELEELARNAPPDCVVLNAGLPGRKRPADRAVTVCAWPLGLGELLELTSGVAGLARAPSGKTVPTPLSLSQRRHVLLLMPNPVEQALATALLHAQGYEVAVANTPEDAIALCHRSTPHALLIEVHPDGCGVAALRRLRQLRQEGSLPDLLLVAAGTNAGQREVARAAGADVVVARPLDAAELRRALALPAALR